jgi:hypothetical protein
MFADGLRSRCAALLLALAAFTCPALADELSDFHDAVEDATVVYNSAMSILETRSQADTAAAVHALRASWQAIGERFAGHRPAAFADDENYATMFFQVDMSLVGVLLVIDLGNRDGARAGLTTVGETLAKLSARSAGTPAR